MVNAAEKIFILEAELAKDPYRVDLLFEKGLWCLLSYNLAGIEKVTDTLARLPGIDDQNKLLMSLLDGSKTLISNGHFWFVFPRNSHPDGQQIIIDLAVTHYKSLTQIKGLSVESIILFEITQAPVSLLDYSIKGLSHIKLSGNLDTPEKFSAAIAHELSHVFWPCKNRVLSEGIALFYECLLSPREAYISSHEKAFSYIDKYSGIIPSIESLLSNSFKNDVFFTDNTSSSDEQFLIYNLAYLLIHDFLTDSNSKDVNALINQINENDDEQAFTVFSTFFKKPLTRFVQPQAIPVKNKKNYISLEQIESRIRRDRLSNEHISFDEYYDDIVADAANSDKNGDLVSIQIRLLLVKLFEHASNRKKIDLISLGLIENLTTSLPPSKFSLEQSYFKAKTKLLRLLVSTDTMEKFSLLSEVDELFKKSLGEHSLKTEAHIDYAKFELAAPATFGRDLQKVNDLLSEVETDAHYQCEINKVRADVALV
ncbi:hypothetical protein ALT761_00303 [Alteromonas sp. 76-1]|uniref:hypothetical protein n=1 Tax=Alteromonas sp. 76-1 TaxID=2358187 RepID=UPI000FD170CA|nr:hypothetical protein [Alteromonas sp. 76-1]VEL95351.1 hypothetical protein ALT761_00303 [Alteromonas sp. 76-1]